MKNISLLFLLLTFLAYTSQAQISAPKYANEFLSIGVGARALGMGNTQTAIANDVTAAYWNPAGLLQIKSKYEVALMHNELFAGGAQYDYAGFATPIDSVSHLALSIVRFGTDNIANTLSLYDANGAINYDNISFFSVADYAFFASYARKLRLMEGLRFGASLKVIHRNVGEFANGWGFGFDVGTQLDRGKWKFGVAARDITGTFTVFTMNTELVYQTYLQTGNQIAESSTEVALPRLVTGAARQFAIGRSIGLLAAIDLDITFDGKRNVPIKTSLASVDPHLGLEVDYKKIIFLRTGLSNIQQGKNFDQSTYTTFQPNFGIGLKLNKFSIDYALTDAGGQSQSLYSNVFSVKVGF